MRVISKAMLQAYWQENAASESALTAWHKHVENARWEKFADLKHSYPQSDVVRGSSNRVVFNISGNRYRLIAVVDFVRHGVLVRWIGTHAEYDGIDATKV